MRNANGTLQVFASGTDQQLWTALQITAKDSTSLTWYPQSLGGSIVGAPSVAANANGTLQVFAQGTDQQLWTAVQSSVNGSTWTWYGLGGGIIGAPSVTANANGTLQVFAQGMHQQVWTAVQSSPNNPVLSWESSIGGGVLGAPSVATNENGTLELFAEGRHLHAWTAVQPSIGSAPPWNWSILGGALAPLTAGPNGVRGGAPAVARNIDLRLEIFVLDLTGNVWHAWQTTPNGGWSIWYPLSSIQQASVNVATYHNDNSRTGQNVHELVLNQANVNTNQFGRLFSVPVDGQIYAQPLYVSNITIAGKGHNVVFVATQGDSVYAFDADTNTPLWHAYLLDEAHGATPGATTINNQNNPGDDPCTAQAPGQANISPQYGVTSTPVIDPSSNTMYVVASSKENGSFIHRLHAIDITTGNERPQGPTVISGSVTGKNGIVRFDPFYAFNRPGLLLSNGVIYVGFGSHCDVGPYHGWVFGYSATSLRQASAFNATPDGTSGSIWMSGAGLASDTNGNIYFATGNGGGDPSPSNTDLVEAIVKLSSNSGLNVADWFVPNNHLQLDQDDQDVGSGGVLLLPDQPGSYPHVLIQAGKPGSISLVNRDQMTSDNVHVCNPTQCILQTASVLASNQPGGFGMPAYWNNDVYFWASNDQLKAFFMYGALDTAPHAVSTAVYQNGATPSISANGGFNGVLWALKTDVSHEVANDGSTGPAVLQAYDAITLQLIYSSDQAPSRDSPGNAVKFATPTVANGKVYVGTDDQLSVFGLLQ
ncbi:MAG: PQQ-binding-like beta-propeller repeat protein [Acidobacteriota bacterium]|nr:PQQ-binding-like beta-propeller repeat protein [Acidobacteriota bacterium]